MDDTLNRISELLEKSGMKKIEFLTALGLKRSAWSAWTSGKANSYKKYLPQIANIFGVSLDWLAGNEQKEKLSSEEESLSGLDKNFLNKIRKLNPQYLKVADSQIDALLALQEKQGK
jgi:transcriptional regulator with XRE-family HTH domain